MTAAILGVDAARPIDAVFINSPLKDYDEQPRINDFTLPVLGLAYLATAAAARGLNVGVLDAEATGLGLRKVAAIVNAAQPRWVGLNLLAPTYRHSVTLLRRLDPRIRVMLGGHQAKAMPYEILGDDDIPRIDALVLGEGDTRVAVLLEDDDARTRLPGVLWRGGAGRLVAGDGAAPGHWLAPDLEALPIVDRVYLVDDPFLADDGRLESAVVGSRGCPYDCSFCGAARSANPGEKWRMRSAEGILAELDDLHARHGVDTVRFVDDLFLAHPRFMRQCLGRFEAERVGERMVWDATGRINVLSHVEDDLLDLMVRTGCREVALGVESGSERVLKYMGKRITPEMTEIAVRRLSERGIKVKGYFILGFPTESAEELAATERHVHRLWDIAEAAGGRFRASAFEFRPYPGTPEWHRLMASDRYRAEELLAYEHVDLAGEGADDAMRERDEFNFSVGIQFGEVPVEEVRRALVRITVEQRARKLAAP
ncbi:MAG: Radical [Conexibacter sp.]|nr:Radical [Conexibacter sp.]